MQNAKDRGIRNILALRGDQDQAGEGEASKSSESATEERGSEKCRFGSDLVNLIKQDFPGDFTVAVAGYPSGHPDAPSYNDDLINLKKKVEAGNMIWNTSNLVDINAKQEFHLHIPGADFVITQLFFKADKFKKFCDDCRAVGITCPIIPGVMPIQVINTSSYFYP